MIFSKEIEKVCAHCEHGKRIHGTEDVICSKKGLFKGDFSCKKFLYTPLHRTPPKALNFGKINLPSLED